MTVSDPPEDVGWVPESYQHMKTVGIIGGGVAGVKACESLLNDGFEVTVFEKREKLGGVWVEGYCNFGLQVPREVYEYPGWRSPDSFPKFPRGQHLQQYVEEYAHHFNLMDNIKLGTTVTSVKRRLDGKPGWVITYGTRSGKYEQLEVDMVLVCSGMYSDPMIPQIPGMENFKGKIVHTKDYTDDSIARDKKVVVVGFGKSAQDIALYSSRVSETTTLVFRNARWPVPRHVLGCVPVKYLAFSRLGHAFLPPYLRARGCVRWLHSVGYGVVWGMWRVVEAVVSWQLSLRACGMLPESRMELDLFSGGSMSEPDFYPSVKSGRIKGIKSGLEGFTEGGILLANGEEVCADVVVFGTGWRRIYPFLDEDTLATLDLSSDGHYLYRHMLHPRLPQLAFVGCNVSTLQNIVTQSVQVRWITALLRGSLQLPPPQHMCAEMAAIREWKKEFVPDRPARGAMLQMHMLHYQDELLRDMGVTPRRKPNPIAELLMPYEAQDYDEVVFTRGAAAANPPLRSGEARRAPSGPSPSMLLLLLLATPLALALLLGVVLPVALAWWVVSAPFLLRLSCGRASLTQDTSKPTLLEPARNPRVPSVQVVVVDGLEGGETSKGTTTTSSPGDDVLSKEVGTAVPAPATPPPTPSPARSPSTRTSLSPPLLLTADRSDRHPSTPQQE